MSGGEGRGHPREPEGSGWIGWFASNSVAANLVMFLMVLGGLLTLPQIPQLEFPDIEVDIISTAVPYPGAAPEEVEEGVCIRIEEELEGVSDIEELTSTAAEGACNVSAELITGANASEALDDVKARVDAIDTFPEDAETPIVEQITVRRGAIDLALSGDLPERALKEIASRVRDELAALPEVTQVEVAGARSYEVAIEVSEAALRRWGLRFDDVADAVRRSSVDLPGGSIKTDGGEVLLRTKGQAYWGPEFEQIVVRTRPDGTRVLLRDVAEVVDGFEDESRSLAFDDEPAVMVRVFRIGDQDLLEIVDAVGRYVDEASLPAGVSLTVWRDGSVPLRGRIDTMVRNGRAGFLLVFIVLALFLRFRLAFWVALGVPIAFFGAIWALPLVGITINVISLFAFILVLGILVDDAIVVGENIYTHQRNHEDPLSAAIAGTREVGVPVVFGVLTTVAAFMPLILVEGTMGQIFGVIGLVVILCLAASLVEALFILPAHLGHGIPADAPGRTRAGGRWTRFQDRFASGLENVIAGPYRRSLAWALSWRYLTLALGISALICTMAVVASGRLRFSFFPSLQADFVIASLTMAQGTPFEVTVEAVEEIAAAGRRLQAELDQERGEGRGSLVQHALVSVGDHPTQNSNQNPSNAGRGTASAGHLGEVTLELVPAEERDVSTEEIAQRWRDLVPPIPGQEELVFQSSFFSAGEAVNVRLRGPNVEELEAAADRVKDLLAGYTGVYDITDSFRAGKREAKLQIRPAGEALGVTQRDLARQVRQAFYGEEAQRVQRGRDDVAVMVRYPADSRRSLGDLENLRIRTANGGEVPFHTVAEVEMGRGYSTIRRTNRQRIVSVTAEVDRTVITGNEVLAQITAGPLQEIVGDYEGMSFFFAGAQEEQRRALGGLARWFVVALFAIYALLAVPLRSYVQPLLIMSVIPFGTVGAILGHLLMAAFKPGFGLSFMSVMGIVALTGVVVNGSLVLIYSLNAYVARGVPLVEAVARASEGRFRPIVLTSITTFVGLTPLLLEQSLQAQFLIPMATSLAFGVLMATLITLFLLPSGILVLDDLRSLPARIRGWRARRRAGGFEGGEGEAIQVPVGGGR